jgi:hypothetical protein
MELNESGAVIRPAEPGDVEHEAHAFFRRVCLCPRRTAPGGDEQSGDKQ